MNESYIRYSVPDGTSILIPFHKFEKMTDVDFKNLDTGYYGKFPHISEDILDLNEVNTEDDELEDLDFPLFEED